MRLILMNSCMYVTRLIVKVLCYREYRAEGGGKDGRTEGRMEGRREGRKLSRMKRKDWREDGFILALEKE